MNFAQLYTIHYKYPFYVTFYKTWPVAAGTATPDFLKMTFGSGGLTSKIIVQGTLLNVNFRSTKIVFAYKHVPHNTGDTLLLRKSSLLTRQASLPLLTAGRRRS